MSFMEVVIFRATDKPGY